MQIPIYAHVKELTDPQTGRRTALEVNYCKFLAYNGSYKLFGWIYIGQVSPIDSMAMLRQERRTKGLSLAPSFHLGAYVTAHKTLLCGFLGSRMHDTRACVKFSHIPLKGLAAGWGT